MPPGHAREYEAGEMGTEGHRCADEGLRSAAVKGCGKPTARNMWEMRNEQKAIRNAFKRIMAALSDLLDKTSRLLEGLVCRGRNSTKAVAAPNSDDISYREYGRRQHLGKAYH